MDKRQVNKLTLFKLIRSRGPIGLIGILFTAISVLVIFPITISLSFMGESYERYDHDDIKENGVSATAEVKSISSMDNVSVNGRHPKVIAYAYGNEGEKKIDRFQTMDLDNLDAIEEESNISIKVLDGESTVTGLEPFRFPYFLFLILPLTFLIIGVVFLVIGVIPALKIYRLYKNGDINEAQITAMVPNSGLPITGIGRAVMVDYFYTDKNGNRIYGNSRTNDFSILGEKKVGDTVKIFVSPEDEKLSCLVPRAEAIRFNWV
ncbi:hypothetical protein AAEO56_01810 [Flavobacterium sp. DGU11]|uniref:DUF3592 domain-containing protein n=1 Tax=Flavobacterium arundinis TaxID=3139143 RepID=A0ABU9HSC2_9FLAO